MKTTIDIPDDLLRQAKARAAHESVTLRELFIRGLHLALAEQGRRQINHVEFPLIRTRPGSHPITSEQVKTALAQMDEE